MLQTRMDAARFAALAEALGWDEDRRWLLGARLVEGTPYRALAALTGRTPGALADDVYRARLEIDGYEARQRDQWGDSEQEQAADERRYTGSLGKALLYWDLSDHHFAFWACVLAFCPWLREGGPLPLEEQQERIIYKYARDQMYAEGKGPAA